MFKKLHDFRVGEKGKKCTLFREESFRLTEVTRDTLMVIKIAR
jgi:hypothetical protein